MTILQNLCALFSRLRLKNKPDASIRNNLYNLFTSLALLAQHLRNDSLLDRITFIEIIWNLLTIAEKPNQSYKNCI